MMYINSCHNGQRQTHQFQLPSLRKVVVSALVKEIYCNALLTVMTVCGNGVLAIADARS